NIIQPFAFTGYQEDEVSGLKFAQARYYKAETGRFQSEDNVKGFIISPFTLNHYGYCWGNPINLVDNDGNLPKWITDAASNIENGVEKISSTAKSVAHTTEKWWDENKGTVAKVAVTTAVVTGLVAGTVLAPGAVGFVCATALASGTISMGVDVVAQVIEHKGFSDFNLNQTLIAGASGALSGALSCVTANPGMLFAGNAIINSTSYAVTQAVNGEEISASGVLINGIIGGIVGTRAGSSNEAMKFAGNQWGWNKIGVGAKGAWAKECVRWIGDEVGKGFARAVGFEGARYTASDLLTDEKLYDIPRRIIQNFNSCGE
ncbi:RHS repeat-associated core domain-containing protein, partial [Butyrivibrio hungatei]|uniref:RHS repeat-associated core domain-containing protein n=1 Tax=Butyrivibrio hungatei TaxID=185008 RepID=UPI00054E4043